MRQVSRGEHGKYVRDANAVVGAEGSSACGDEIAIDHQLDRVVDEVEFDSFGLLADHVKVTVKNQRFGVLQSALPWLTHQDAVEVIPDGLKP